MSTEKLSELSKPVAWDFPGSKEESRQLGYDFELDDEQKVNCSALYSQEYVSALLAELEAKDKRIAELEAKLATPVRLPDVRQSSSGDRYQWSDGAHNYRLDVISMLLGAGFTVAVEGDSE